MESIELNTWVSIAEIVSGMAVVISLLYVGFEIKRSTKESDADVYEALISRTIQRRVLVAENADLAEIITKGNANLDSLSDAEKLRYVEFSELLYATWERAWDARKGGVLSERVWTMFDNYFTMKADRAPEFLWNAIRSNWDMAPIFQSHVDAKLRSGRLVEPNF